MPRQCSTTIYYNFQTVKSIVWNTLDVVNVPVCCPWCKVIVLNNFDSIENDL